MCSIKRSVVFEVIASLLVHPVLGDDVLQLLDIGARQRRDQGLEPCLGVEIEGCARSPHEDRAQPRCIRR
jgi:hypothetical protein